MIDTRKLKELVKLMVSNDLIELDLRDPDEQVTLRRPSPNQSVPMMTAAPAPVAPAPVSAAPSTGLGVFSLGVEAALPEDTLPTLPTLPSAQAPMTRYC